MPRSNNKPAPVHQRSFQEPPHIVKLKQKHNQIREKIEAIKQAIVGLINEKRQWQSGEVKLVELIKEKEAEKNNCNMQIANLVKQGLPKNYTSTILAKQQISIFFKQHDDLFKSKEKIENKILTYKTELSQIHRELERIESKLGECNARLKNFIPELEKINELVNINQSLVVEQEKPSSVPIDLATQFETLYGGRSGVGLLFDQSNQGAPAIPEAFDLTNSFDHMQTLNAEKLITIFEEESSKKVTLTFN